jgi:hypothetical protein
MKNSLARRAPVFAAVALAALATGPVLTPAHAGSITYVASGTNINNSGLPFDVEAVFTTSAGSLDITLTNLQANPTSVIQNLSDLSFTVSGNSLTGASLTSSSAQEITVNANGTFTLGATVATGWVPNFSASSGILDVLNGAGHAGPAHTIIGPPGGGGTYSNANNSIAGNAPHNPFLNQTATFTISAPSITSATTVTSATFSFGTESGVNVAGHVGQAVPEPSSLVLGLTGLGLAGTVGLYRTLRRS